MNQIKPSIPRGMRDFLPEQMLKRKYVIETIQTIFEKYGYEPLETPAIEKMEILSGKYGEEGDQLLFKILKRGTGIEKVGSEILEYSIKNYQDIIDFGLRYDLTVPLCRLIAMYQNQITLPFKRYQIQPVWRADRPQKGRYREFYQCDADIVGTDSILADAETIAIINEVLTTLGFKHFKTRINNRKILLGIVEYSGVKKEKGNDVCVAIDKLEKIGIDGVKNELYERGIPQQAITKILPILEIKGKTDSIINDIVTVLKNSEIGVIGVTEIKQLLLFLHEFAVPDDNFVLDLYLARGLAYYTGPIYESVVEKPKIGSLTGGGRYDELIGMFLGRQIPATGTTIGIERIIDVMTELKMLPENKTITKVLVATFNDNMRAQSLNLVTAIRAAGMNAEVFYDGSSLKKQFGYADKKGIPYVVIQGPDEYAKNEVTLKDMKSGEQKQIKVDDMIKALQIR